MSDAFIGRRAIFDASLRVHAYELMYRVGEVATQDSSVTSLLESSAKRLMPDDLCFFELTGEHLAGLLPLPLPSGRVVGRVSSVVEPTPDTVRGVVRLKSKGVQIALSDYVHRPGKNLLLKLCDHVELDVQARSVEELERVCEALRPYGMKLLATKVETLAGLRRCEALGFEHFTGGFLTNPERGTGESRSAGIPGLLPMLSRFLDPETEIDEHERMICQLPGLASQLLGYANSALYAPQQPIEGVGQMLMMLGLEVVRRVVSMIAMLEVVGEAGHLPLHTLVRARMCESLAERCRIPKPVTFYTTGLFSTLDALTGTSLQKLLAKRPMAPVIQAALLGGEGDQGAALRCVRAFEVGDWDAAVFRNLSAAELSEAHAQSVEHSRQICVGVSRNREAA